MTDDDELGWDDEDDTHEAERGMMDWAPNPLEHDDYRPPLP